MAQSQQQQKQHSQSVFPSPPSFYSLYTDENLSLWQKLYPPLTPPSPSSRSIISSQEIEESKPHTSLSEIEVEKLTELERTIVERWKTEEVNLSPPQIVDGEYHMFGNYLTTSDKTPTLEEHGCPQLYPKGDIDHRAELKKLNFSLLFTFLELIDTLIESPEHFTSYLEQLKVIFLNIHHLISAYRPYQATETLKLLLERQIKERQKMKKDVENICRSIQENITAAKNYTSSTSSSIVTPLSEFNNHKNDVASLNETSESIQKVRERGNQKIMELLREL